MRKSNVRTITKVRRSIRAISPVISVLLMIAIAVAASLVAYAWVMGYLNFTTTKVGKAIQIQSIAYDGSLLYVYVQNVGEGTVNFLDDQCLYLQDILQTSGVTVDPTKLEPGQTTTITVPYSAGEGELVKVKVVTSDGTFTEAQATVSAGAAAGFTLTVTSAYGATGGGGWYNSGASAQATVSPLTVAGPTDTQYVFTQWSGDASGTTSPSNPITMNAPKTATANWKTQYRVQFAASPPAGGTPSPPTPIWYDAGATGIPISTTVNTGYVFASWSANPPSSITFANPLSSSTTMTVNGAGTVTATFNGPKLVYTGGDSQTRAVGATSAQITVQRQTVGGTPVTAGTTTVNLASSSGGGHFYSDSGGSNEITYRDIGAGSSTANFYYRDNTAGSPTLTASASGYSSATTIFTITGPAAKLVYTTGISQTLAPNSMSTVITVQRRDQADNPVTSGGITVNLATTATATGRFYNEGGGQITSVTISNGNNYATFYYRDTTVGTPTLTASSGTLTPAVTQFTITNKVVVQIASSFTPSNSITPGSQVRDTARLVGATASAGGTFTYYLYRGTFQFGTPTLIDSDPVTVTNGVVPDSKQFTVPQADAYYFLTQYSGDAANGPVAPNAPEGFVAWPLSQTILSRPNADTSDNHLGTQQPSGSAHYTCVNQVNQDGDTSYVYNQQTNFWTDDVYDLSNPTHTGVVSYITINAVARTTGTGSMQLAITTNSQEFDGSSNPGLGFPLTTSYREYTTVWKTNPATGATWTWSEIDALQIGVSLYSNTAGGARCTQVYIQIYYTP